MNKKRIYIALGIVVCLTIGFFAGQEHTKYQLRKAITDAFSDLGNVLSDDTDNTSSKTIKDKEVKDEKPVVDTSITIKKGDTKTVSSKYRSENIEATITLNDVSFIDEIKPPEPQQDFYSYYPEKEGKTYAVISLKLKNLGSSSFRVENVINNNMTLVDIGHDNLCTPKAIFGGKYEYTADVIAELGKDSKGKYSFEDYSSIDPLETMDIIIAYSVPTEVKDKDAELNICLGNQKINLDFTTEEPIKNTIENIEENTEEE